MCVRGSMCELKQQLYLLFTTNLVLLILKFVFFHACSGVETCVIALQSRTANVDILSSFSTKKPRMCMCVFVYAFGSMLMCVYYNPKRVVLINICQMMDLICITMCTSYFLHTAVNLRKDYISMREVKEIVVVQFFRPRKTTHFQTLHLSNFLSLSLSLSEFRFHYNFCVFAIKDLRKVKVVG